MRRQNESNVVSHLLDNLFSAGYGDLSLSKYEHLYNKKSYLPSGRKKKITSETKCMIINNKLYCEEIEH
jgi:hypothetical protein